MRHFVRLILMIFVAAIVGGVGGCASSGYQQGMQKYQPDDAAAALRELKPLAEQGNAEAQFRLGSLFYQGWGVPQDYQEATRWLHKAADQKNVYAQVTLGTIYADGVQGVVAQDYSHALMWFILAAAQGDAEAMKLRDALATRMTPTQIAEGQKMAREFKPFDAYAKLLLDLKARSEQGEATAQFQVALQYYHGQGTPRNYSESLAWFKKAALQGHVIAQYNAGYMYEKGEGTPQDYREAGKFYRMAAERGHQMAQYMLGSLCEKGRGVVQDEVQALMWYNLAAVHGEPKAQMARDRIHAWMTPEQIIEAQRLAREFKVIGK
jgi:uncharacterized protein